MNAAFPWLALGIVAVFIATMAALILAPIIGYRADPSGRAANPHNPSEGYPNRRGDLRPQGRTASPTPRRAGAGPHKEIAGVNGDATETPSRPGETNSDTDGTPAPIYLTANGDPRPVQAEGR